MGSSPCPEETEEEEERKKKKRAEPRNATKAERKKEKEKGKIKNATSHSEAQRKVYFFCKEKETTGCGGLITLNLLHNKKDEKNHLLK